MTALLSATGSRPALLVFGLAVVGLVAACRGGPAVENQAAPYGIRAEASAPVEQESAGGGGAQVNTPSREPGDRGMAEADLVAPETLVKTFAFKPGARDIAFTVNKRMAGGQADLYLMAADEQGDLTGRVASVASLKGEVEAVDKVLSSTSAGIFALGVTALADDGGSANFSDLWLLDLAGERPRNLTAGAFQIVDFWWTPPGDELAILTADGSLVARATAQGTDDVIATGLLQPSGAAGVEPAWSADGRKVLLATTDPTTLGGRLELVDRSSRIRTTLADLGPGSQAKAVFSADGASIYALVDSESGGTYSTQLMRLTLSGASQVLATVSSGVKEPAWTTSMVLDEDGDRIFYVLGQRLYVIQTDGTAKTALVADQTVRGELRLLSLTGGQKRLGYLASALQGEGASAGTPNAGDLSTTVMVRSLDISE